MEAPARAALRRLIETILRSDSDLDAFCLDHFEGVYRRFTDGMDRVRKMTLLLEREATDRILEALAIAHPDEVKQHATLTSRPGAMSAWMDLEIETEGGDLRVRVRRGEKPVAHTLPEALGIEALQRLAGKVGRAVREGNALDGVTVKEAQAFHEAVFAGDLGDVLAALRRASKDGPVLIRLFTGDPVLAAFPWEALCEPGTDHGFLGTDPGVLFARAVCSDLPFPAHEVNGAVRVLAIAPGSDPSALAGLEEALRHAIDAGEVEWLDPIAGPDVSAGVLFDRLRSSQTPHVVHWLSDGRLSASQRPELRLAGDAWVLAEAVARELGASFKRDLRLVVLEAGQGAAPGALGSAAEVFSRAGADAVVAHLWPVKAPAARACSTAFYRALTLTGHAGGDVAASLAAARRTLLVESAEAFSPILFLRRADSALFDFTGRRVHKPGPRKPGLTLAPKLATLLDRPFTLVLGDLEEDRAALRQQLEQVMTESGEAVPPGLSLAALTQRYVLLREGGRDALGELFQEALASTPQVPAPPLVGGLARLAGPGVHLTLLWRPHLERALAETHPDRTLYAIQPGSSTHADPRVVKRAAGEATWKRERKLPRRFDLDEEIVVLRLHGGYSAEVVPILSKPAVTEDDHLQGIEADPAPQWLHELLGLPRSRPSLFAGLSVLDWRHRMLLRWLYNKGPAPQGSVALMSPTADPREPAMWNSGASLPGSSSIAAVQEEGAALASLLDAHTPGGAS